MGTVNHGVYVGYSVPEPGTSSIFTNHVQDKQIGVQIC